MIEKQLLGLCQQRIFKENINRKIGVYIFEQNQNKYYYNLLTNESVYFWMWPIIIDYINILY